MWPWLVQLGQDRPGSYRITNVDPGRAMMLEHGGAFVLRPTGDGKTRFIIRTTISHRAMPVWASTLNFMAFEVPHFIMERRMMLTIKTLAEQHTARAALLR